MMAPCEELGGGTRTTGNAPARNRRSEDSRAVARTDELLKVASLPVVAHRIELGTIRRHVGHGFVELGLALIEIVQELHGRQVHTLAVVEEMVARLGRHWNRALMGAAKNLLALFRAIDVGQSYGEIFLLVAIVVVHKRRIHDALHRP